MRIILISIFLCMAMSGFANTFTLQSPDKNITLTIDCKKTISYSLSYKGKQLLNASPLGFEFNGEPAMSENFVLLNAPVSSSQHDSWEPVVKNKHAKIDLQWNEMKLSLIENGGERRKMDIFFRAYDNGIAFRYQLYGCQTIGNRAITRELTGFSVPSSAQAWVAEYPSKYTSSQESEFNKQSVSGLSSETLAGLPFLIEVDKQNYLAITEANIDDYPGFYIGCGEGSTGESVLLTTKLSPLPGEKEGGVKARFSDKIYTPWRVVMVGDNPGKFIESEIVQGLNPPCAIENPSWIKPGMCAWDHWWSGEVKMEMPVIKEYIDFASAQMLH